jgi:hypothetical protein
MWRLHGLRGVREALAARLYGRQRYLRFVIDLPSWVPADIPLPGVEIRSGIEALDAIRGGGSTLPLEFHADRLQGARYPYLAFVDGRVGHISWMLTDREHTRLIRLRPWEVELDFAYTVPECRGRRLLTAVETAILRDARERGALVAYTHVAEANVASIRGVLKTGFRACGLVTLSWICGTAWRRFDRHEAARPSSAPVVDPTTAD